jgi:hypothetical protein
MPTGDSIGVEQFLLDYPKMANRPCAGTYLRLKGSFAFIGNHPTHGQVRDAFSLQIEVPAAFPRELPEVKEIGGRIPRVGEFHVNGDGSLCLGSHLRLLLKLKEAPTLVGFAERCLVPYLYAISRKLTHGGKLVFGELAHEGPGMLQDYAQLFGVPTTVQARYALELLGTKKRIANKLPCPCGCKRRLGRCRFNRHLAQYRKLASRSWFKRQLLNCR